MAYKKKGEAAPCKVTFSLSKALSGTNRTTTTLMIRVFTVFCKLNQISFSDRQWLEKDLDGFYPGTGGACPFCRAKGCLSKFACYDRYLIELKEGTPVAHEVRVPRYRCTSCGHTHALISCSLVPYRSYSLRFILQTLRCYFLHQKTTAALCEAAGISLSTLYEWKKLFLRQKSLWLGILSDMEEPAVHFLEGLSGKLLMDFHGVFLFSYLEHMQGTDGEGPPGPCRTGRAVT